MRTQAPVPTPTTSHQQVLPQQRMPARAEEAVIDPYPFQMGLALAIDVDRQRGDALLVDNVAIAHGHRTFTSSSRVPVACRTECRRTDHWALIHRRWIRAPLPSVSDRSSVGLRCLSPSLATMKLAEYGEANMDLALRGLELKTLDPYLSGWRMRVVPALGHLAVRMITNGVVDRTVQNWIADEHSRSTVKNTIAVLVRAMEQAVRDGIINVNPARVTGWQKLYK
ncbi:hypothetical protein ACWEQ7_18735 [Streptomyces sp. NPDC004069]